MKERIKTDLKSLAYEEMEEYIAGLGEKRFRAGQLYRWIHVAGAASFEEMTNLPASLRHRLEEESSLTALRELDVRISKEDGTRKYLFELADGNVIESVLMRYRYGNSVCISSQVGCAMGCRFCASTIGGRIRDLTAAEMLDQIYRIQAHTGERVSHVVVMGTGEPLDNYDNLLRFIRLLTDERGLHISQRNITVSTCGIVPRIYDLAKERLGITLALSLHASSQEKRLRLMPIARRYDLGQVLDACRAYFEQTGRRISFEYSLVAGENDTREDAAALTSLIRDMNCHVNLIPVNPVRERTFRAPAREAVERFARLLTDGGINVTIRRELGQDIDGACGQLRRSYMEKR